MNLDLSIVVPLYNEAESLPELSDWIDKVIVSSNLKYELIFIDDGSKDNCWEVINNIQ
jgi:glycosyltransferase involved in cell wall biosynthesis